MSKTPATKKTAARVTAVTPADWNHQVVSTEGGAGGYRKKPCATCPWRVDACGEFPAEAFRISAHTAYDMSNRTFGCHESGSKKPTTCAGFLLRGAAHNLSVRLGYVHGRYKDDVSDGGVELYENYRAMAVDNGVDDTDPVLAKCRD